MIYEAGEITVTGQSGIVIGHETDFIAAGIQPGAFLSLPNFVDVFPIVAIINSTELRLSRAIPTLGAGAQLRTTYWITADFTGNLQLSYPNKGDMDNAEMLRRAFGQLDEAFGILIG